MKKLSDIAASVVPPFQSCGNCSKDGWITHYGGRAAEVQLKCSCWKLWWAKVQAATAKQGRG